jgi:hypothetical protein
MGRPKLALVLYAVLLAGLLLGAALLFGSTEEAIPVGG